MQRHKLVPALEFVCTYGYIVLPSHHAGREEYAVPGTR